MAFQKLVDAVEDVLSLEVATMTSTTGINLARDLSNAEKQTLEDARTALKDRNTAVATAIGANDEAAIKQARGEAEQAEKHLRAVEKSLAVFDPRDTFSRILAKLGEDENVALVAYSRFEIEGDSVNYISANESYQKMIESHGELVEASQASRKALFEFVKGLVS